MSGFTYGPVPSRRLGRSLGVDLVPFKTCTYDCIYCQLGRTTCKTVERKEWAPLEEVLGDVRAALASKPDFITISGSGEPTLHAGLNELIGRIKEMTDVPVAVLTNGSLLWLPEVRAGLREADLVMPSLDVGDEFLFRYVNRPHESLRFEPVVEGLIAFREEFRGRYWLEVLLLGGVTAIPAEVAKIAEVVQRIRPDRVQLNTAIRPPAEDYALPVERAELEEIAAVFGDRAEVIADYAAPGREGTSAARRDEIVALLRRRPCTLDDIAQGLDLHRNEVLKRVEGLVARGTVGTQHRKGRLYYYAPAPNAARVDAGKPCA